MFLVIPLYLKTNQNPKLFYFKLHQTVKHIDNWDQ